MGIIKTSLVFIGGMFTGGYCITNAALKSETFVASLKETIANKTVETIFGPETKRGKREAKVSYASFYNNQSPRRSSPYFLERIEDVTFGTRQDAEDALTTMKKVLKDYGIVSLADARDIAGVSSMSYISTKYGWTSLDKAEIMPFGDGYFIKLPRPIEIK